MGFTIETGISGVTVFLQGLLSFFSPCVLPLVPLYIGYLAGGAKTVDEDGVIHYRRSKVIVNTLFFVLGVSFAFFLLGFGFTAVGKFFSGNRVLFARIGGVLVILFGVLQLFGSNVFTREHRLPFRLSRFSMNPAVALILGFTFSFAWTPCVGPALTSVLLMASSASSSAVGYALIGVYTLGFVIPFLAVGLFTGAVLDFFKRHQKGGKIYRQDGRCADDPDGDHDAHRLDEWNLPDIFPALGALPEENPCPPPQAKSQGRHPPRRVKTNLLPRRLPALMPHSPCPPLRTLPFMTKMASSIPFPITRARWCF